MRSIRTLLFLTIAGCATRPPHTYPEEMSAQAHLSEAEHHRLEAARAQQRIEEREQGRYPKSGYSYRWDTEVWLNEDAESEHLAAVNALEREYAFACALIPAAEQAASPLDANLEGFTSDARAVVLHLNIAAGPPAALVQRLRCHRARMAYLGLASMRDCPLGLPRLLVTVRPNSDNIDVIIEPRDPRDVPELARRAQSLLAHRPPGRNP
jgi:hypothetical protein